jgi:3-hydroxyacyl-[acyl-carrier-protein] dehydratase
MSVAPELSLSAALWTPACGASPIQGVGHCRVTARDGRRFELEIEQPFEAGNVYQAAHFPAFRIYPGVFLLETLRQGLSTVVGAARPVRIEQVRSMRFLVPVLDGAEVSLAAILEPGPGPANWTVKARCMLRDGTEAAQIALVVAGVPDPDSWPEVADG